MDAWLSPEDGGRGQRGEVRGEVRGRGSDTETNPEMVRRRKRKKRQEDRDPEREPSTGSHLVMYRKRYSVTPRGTETKRKRETEGERYA